MLITLVKAEDWKPSEASAVLRAQPDKAAALVTTILAGTVLRTIAEVKGNDGGSWRLTESSGVLAYLCYRTATGPGDWAPLTPGGDPTVDAQLDALIARQAPPGASVLAPGIYEVK